VLFLERRPGRAAGEERVVIATEEGRPAASGLWFAGRPGAGIRPWVDLEVTDPSILPEIAEAVGPGGSLMVRYEGDETERALRRRVPPAATELGLEMLRAGVRWFKDWYCPEGGREGGTKLQGTLPLDNDRKQQAETKLKEELEGYLNSKAGNEADQDRSRQALELLGT
jgi:hypothetical protein